VQPERVRLFPPDLARLVVVDDGVRVPARRDAAHGVGQSAARRDRRPARARDRPRTDRIAPALGVGAARRRRRAARAAARRRAGAGARSAASRDAGTAGAAPLLRVPVARGRAASCALRRHGGGRRGVSSLAHVAIADRGDAPARGGRVMAVVEARGVTRLFPMAAGPVAALRDVSLRVDAGEYVAVSGPSGCGKSTLLHLVGVVDQPTSGAILFEGRDVAALPESERSRIRLVRIGFIFQRFFLLPMLTAGENIALPQAEARVAAADRRARTRQLLDYVGLGDRADHLPSQLSGGEMQRVAIARALANKPALLVADEPT